MAKAKKEAQEENTHTKKKLEIEENNCIDPTT